ncbi:MAG: ABC transporter ATP-binding protein [Saccharofermentanales bacterium]
MIEISNVSKSYNGKVKAVDNISLEIRNGEIFGFLGPNGAGKTTTIKLITGILSADEGTIKVSGYDIASAPLEAKQNFGYVPDDPNIFPRLKGFEYLKFMGDVYNVPADIRAQRIRSMSARFGLENALGDRIQSFSHGMRQKLLIIGALLHNPDVWILDEPMTGLDPKSAFQLKEMMREHADNGKSVFFSTHVLDVAEKICDRISIVDKGRILFTGTVEEMRSEFKSSESLESMFLELTAENEG